MNRVSMTAIRSATLVGAFVALTVLAACGPRHHAGPAMGASNLTDEQHAQNSMSGCMQYASQDYCRQHIYGK